MPASLSRCVWGSTLAVIAMCALAACASETPEATYTVRDSAGVKIVTNSDPLWGEKVFATLADSPELAVGMREGPTDYLFSDIVSAVRSPSGRLMVADGTSGDIRVFDDSGRLQTRFGGQGSGPGEFQYIESLQAVSGDSSVVWDRAAGRLSVFNSQGGLESDFSLPERPVHVWWLAPDRYLLQVSASGRGTPEGTEPSLWRDTARFEAWAPGGEPSALLRRMYPASEEVVLIRKVGGLVRMATAARLFGRDVHVASSPERIAVGSSDHFSIDVVNIMGAPLHTLRMSGTERPATQQDLDRWMQGRLERSGDTPEVRAALDLVANSVPLPTLMPSFEDLRFDDNQNLWVREFAAPDVTETRWLVFDKDGAYCGSVTVPAELHITDLGTDEVIGVWTDDLDVESVRVYAIEKG